MCTAVLYCMYYMYCTQLIRVNIILQKKSVPCDLYHCVILYVHNKTYYTVYIPRDAATRMMTITQPHNPIQLHAVMINVNNFITKHKFQNQIFYLHYYYSCNAVNSVCNKCNCFLMVYCTIDIEICSTGLLRAVTCNSKTFQRDSFCAFPKII